MKFPLFFLTLTVPVSILLADPTPLSNPNDLGLARSLVLTGTPSGSSQMGVGGGEFSGTVNGATTLFWCVDDQEFFAAGDSGYGNVTLLSNVASQSNYVKYGNVTNSGSPAWTNKTDTYDSVSLPNTATARFEMAAYLVEQYNGFVGSESGAVVNNTSQDLAIQEAIWSLTNNNTLSGGFSTISGNDTNNTTDQYWIHQALANYTSVNMQDWAVVSWTTDSYGNLSTTSNKQTFLVQVAPTPEPRMVGLMILGMAGLCFVGQRRLAAAKQ
jgi:hypothetical protein